MSQDTESAYNARMTPLWQTTAVSRPAAARSGEKGAQPILHLSRALAARRAKIEPVGLPGFHQIAKPGAQIRQRHPFPLGPIHLDQPRIRRFRPVRSVFRRFPSPGATDSKPNRTPQSRRAWSRTRPSRGRSRSKEYRSGLGRCRFRSIPSGRAVSRRSRSRRQRLPGVAQYAIDVPSKRSAAIEISWVRSLIASQSCQAHGGSAFRCQKQRTRWRSASASIVSSPTGVEQPRLYHRRRFEQPRATEPATTGSPVSLCASSIMPYRYASLQLPASTAQVRCGAGLINASIASRPLRAEVMHAICACRARFQPRTCTRAGPSPATSE